MDDCTCMSIYCISYKWAFAQWTHCIIIIIIIIIIIYHDWAKVEVASKDGNRDATLLRIQYGAYIISDAVRTLETKKQ